MSTLRTEEVSAVLGRARCGGGRLFETVDGDAAREGQCEKGDGEQLAHGGDSDEGRFQQPPLLHATAGVGFSRLTKATPPATG
jgi:hypothetical protein